MRGVALFLSAVVAAIVVPIAAHADAPQAPPQPAAGASAPAAKVSTPKRRRKPKPAAPAEPALPQPNIRLTLDAPAPDAPWTMRVENTGQVPVEILADVRFLALDVTLPDAKRAIRCQLPHSMLPADTESRQLVVPPQRAYVEKFDPRLFCFGARESEALSNGAKVVPVLVATAGSADVIAAIDGVEPLVANERTWSGVEATIGEGTPPPAGASGAHRSRPLAISSTPFVDAARGQEAAIEITVTNEAAIATRFLFRTETLAFDVTGPSGVGVTDPSPTVHCGFAGEPVTPIAEVLTTLTPKEQASIDVILGALCPEHTLDHPGLYVVRAKLDTRRVVGRTLGLRTFDGEVAADATTHLRIQTAGTAAANARERRPQLAPAPPPPAP
jgi:hypothetical protein